MDALQEGGGERNVSSPLNIMSSSAGKAKGEVVGGKFGLKKTRRTEEDQL